MDWKKEQGGKPKNATAFCNWYIKNIGTDVNFNSIRPTVYMAIGYSEEVLAFIREKFMAKKVSFRVVSAGVMSGLPPGDPRAKAEILIFFKFFYVFVGKIDRQSRNPQ